MKTLLPVAFIALTSCVEIADEDTGEVELALGENACATVSLTSPGTSHGRTIDLNATKAFTAQDSPDSKYDAIPGAGDSACPKQYVVEFTDLATLSGDDYLLEAEPLESGNQAGWAGITNESDCERTRVYTGLYVWDDATGPDSEYNLNEIGLWSAGACAPSVVSGSLPPISTTKFKFRVAGRVHYCASVGCDAALYTDLPVRITYDVYP